MSNKYSNIPKELQELPQWICWKYEDIGASKPTKLPINPKNGKLAAVDSPESWASFKEAIEKSSNYSGIGFVFTELNGLTFIDLDDTQGDKTKTDRQIEIYKELNSYSEISPSGNGLHVIVKANVIAGRKRDFIEIYSTLRYATFTGNVYHDAPIADRQEIVTRIWESLGAAPLTFDTSAIDKPEVQNDSHIITQAEKASNGEKFKALFAGDFSDYPSQSEADFALIDIIAFYTQNRKQIARVFRLSKLGQREKAKRDLNYITPMIDRAFDRQLPQVDIEGFEVALKNKLAEQQELALIETQPKKKREIKEPTPQKEITLPPGLMGHIAQFIYAASPLPVAEIALAGAIGLMGGIAGRAYNVNGEGLNQYLILIALSGTGKEGMSIGIDRLLEIVRLQVPTASEIIGPGEISSGEAIVRYVNKNPCFVSILGEFGYRLQSWSGSKANPNNVNLKRILLDLYHKSGYGRIFRPKVFSDKDKDIKETVSPAISILGETTPRTFYDYIDDQMLEDGLLPRFLIIEYKGEVVELNKNCSTAYPPNWLIDSLASFTANCETLSHSKKVINVEADEQAAEILDTFGKKCRLEMNTLGDVPLRYLWARAHLKAWKLAALVAVGVNMFKPIITADNLNWAIDLVIRDVESLTDKLESGVVGANQTEVKQASDALRVIKKFLTSPWTDVEGMAKNGKKSDKEKLLFESKIIPYCYLSRSLMTSSSFKNDKMGATFALKRTLQGLVDTDKIREIPKADLAIKFGTTQRAFMLSDLRELEN